MTKKNNSHSRSWNQRMFGILEWKNSWNELLFNFMSIQLIPNGLIASALMGTHYLIGNKLTWYYFCYLLVMLGKKEKSVWSLYLRMASSFNPDELTVTPEYKHFANQANLPHPSHWSCTNNDLIQQQNTTCCTSSKKTIHSILSCVPFEYIQNLLQCLFGTTLTTTSLWLPFSE